MSTSSLASHWCLSLTAHPKSSSVTPRAAAISTAKWDSCVLDVGFIPKQREPAAYRQGSSYMQNVVREICDLWRTETGANIQFRFRRIVDKKTPIRIGFSANNGSWSYIGTTALAFGFDENQPTMALAIADDTPVEAMRRVILHEFGHALGLGHEHQNPAFSMTWNDQAVRNDLMMQGWNEAMIEANVLHPLRHGETTFTEFDPHSIMLYPIPAHWTQEGQATAWNTTLSERDKKFAHDFLCPPSHGVR